MVGAGLLLAIIPCLPVPQTTQSKDLIIVHITEVNLVLHMLFVLFLVDELHHKSPYEWPRGKDHHFSLP